MKPVSRGFYPAIAGEARGKAVEAVKIEINIAKLIFGKAAEGRECEAVKLIRDKKAAAGAAWGEIVATELQGMHCQAPKRTDAGGRRLAASPHRGLTQLSLSWLRLG